MGHIVLDARAYFTTTGRYIRNLVNGLAAIESDHRFTLLLPPEGIAQWTPPSSRFRAVPSAAAFFSLNEQTLLARQIRSLKPDLVHFCMQQQPLWIGVPRITTFHDMTLLKIRNAKKPLAVSLLRRAAGWAAFTAAAHVGRANIVVSRYSGDDLRRFTGASPSKTVLTYPAADVVAAAAERVALPSGRFVLFVGNQVPYKNLERLVDAVRLVRREHPDVHLVVAGRIDDDGRRILDRRPEIAQNAHFTGYVSDGQLRWLYENASVFAFPSFFEGFGLPGLEAMRHGCPVVSSSATCLPEVYGDAALYFDPERVDEIASALRRVLLEPALRGDLVQRGHERAELYSWRRMARQTHDVYERSLRGR
ncbi:glycosyltransferase family 4 protein [Microbacterium hydrothermale]|uniref:glycosyltransferase family 4 protein n=1 Tax=Microbacterium hydrothermale TaxID=857427 RepID=UPI0010A873A5|nr:glycosyltransferase family 1 protein [Microbacterium hydrothermale]